LEIFTNKIINKTNQSLDKFRYNVIIANYHEIYTFFKKIADNKKNYKNLKKNFEKILTIMMPVIPHIASENLDKLNCNKNISWPKIDPKYLDSENVVIVIQINGKKRNSISVPKDIGEDDLNSLIKEKKLINKYLDNGELTKKIYIKNRLINYILRI